MSINPEDKDREFLYKYRPLIGTPILEINKNTQRLLENGELFFSKPSQFNDPFDSKITFDVNATEPQLRIFFSRVFKEFGRPLSDIDNIIEQIKRDKRKLLEFVPSNSYADLTNIFCLSRDEKNILMWSHYAKDHTGICIGFKVHIWGNSLNIRIKSGYARPIAGISNDLLPVVYIDYKNEKPKPYNHFIHTDKELEPYFYTKSKLWEYEKEVRIILSDGLIIKNPVCIEQLEIGEIIFGLKTPQSLIKEVEKIVKKYPNNGKDTKLYKCVEIANHYAIDKVLL
jgi:hypothetical protein